MVDLIAAITLVTALAVGLIDAITADPFEIWKAVGRMEGQEGGGR